ncbi:hypothetical protein M3Y97_00978300 [Aphelenchoides bicaudatus]|nr:hypothetical protein M3Y97_00978300 [Aphelenchoides bicaudatus]
MSKSKGVQMNFTAGSAVLDLKEKVFLEDFYYENENEGAKFEDLHNLTLGISFNNNGSPADEEVLYTQAIQNLLKMAPNLKAVHFYGSYVFDPINDETFCTELSNLRQHFDSLSKLFKTQELPVAAVNFQGTQLLEQYSVDEAIHSDLINKLFAYKLSEQELESHTANFTFTPNDVPFHIRLSFNVKTKEGKLKNRFMAADNHFNNVETC